MVRILLNTSSFMHMNMNFTQIHSKLSEILVKCGEKIKFLFQHFSDE